MMDRRISENEIQYLMDHLAMFYSGASLGQYLVTEKSSQPSLFFPLSEMPIDENRVEIIHDIPVLLRGERVVFAVGKPDQVPP